MTTEQAPAQAWAVYTLIDPRDGAVRYVGFTIDPATRLRGHLNEARKVAREGGQNARCRWVNELLGIDLEPVMKVIARGRGPNWPQAERRWIAHYRTLGADLTNATDGGEGVPGWKHGPEARAKISAAVKGRKLPPGTGAKIAAKLRGRKQPPEVVARRAASNTGRPRTPKQLAADEARRGRKLSPEHVAKIQAANRARRGPVSPETRAKIAAALRGKPFTPGRRAKLKGRKPPRPIVSPLKGRPLDPLALAKRMATEAKNRAERQARGEPDYRAGVPHLKMRGQKRDPAAVEKTAAAVRGRKQSAEEIERRAAALRGKKRTPEQCERIRQATIAAIARKKAR